MSTEASCTAAAGRTDCDVTFDNGAFAVDLDAASGGGKHPTPHEILDAALAACTALSLELYATRKGMKLERVRVNVQHSGAPGSFTMQRTLAFEGEQSDADRASLLRIAEACPIHKTLAAGPIKIETAVASSS